MEDQQQVSVAGAKQGFIIHIVVVVTVLGNHDVYLSPPTHDITNLITPIYVGTDDAILSEF